MSLGKRTTQTSKREAGYHRLRAEQPDRDGQYHGLHRSYAGNGSCAKQPQNKQKPRKAGPRSLLDWDEIRLARLKVKCYITRDISNDDCLVFMFQRILPCPQRGRKIPTVRAWL